MEKNLLIKLAQIFFFAKNLNCIVDMHLKVQSLLNILRTIRDCHVVLTDHGNGYGIFNLYYYIILGENNK